MSKDILMKSALIRLNVALPTSQRVDYNKKFLKMVRINLMFDDGGG